jgi:cation:H+ antiporter
MRLIHANRAEPPFASGAEDTENKPGMARVRTAIAGFLAATFVLLFAAPYLAASAADLAAAYHVSDGLAGTVLLALATSLPEAAVSVTAVRTGAYSLAVGNLLGSNCFNMAALVPLDIIHGGPPLLAAAGSELAIAALCAIALMSLAMLDVLNKAERSIGKIEIGPVLMIVVYLAGLYATYRAAFE